MVLGPEVLHVNHCTTSMLASVEYRHNVLIDCAPTYNLVPFYHATSSLLMYSCLTLIITTLQQTTKPSSINASLVLIFAKMLPMPVLAAIGIFCSQVYANIVFNVVQLTCNHRLPKSQQGCLLGQTCLQDDL